MRRLNDKLARGWSMLGPRFLPFADAATAELPLPRLLRLSLFQVSVGMALVLLNGTLNRVMIVELGVPSWLVALMVSLPLVFAPFRALIGFRSDTHRSVLGWRRVPYIWFGTLLQFGGLAIMPFALIVLSGDANGPVWIGYVGLRARLPAGRRRPAHDADRGACARDRPRAGGLAAARRRLPLCDAAARHGGERAASSARCSPISAQVQLIQVIQGAAVVTMVLNCIALWKQEARKPVAHRSRRGPAFVPRGVGCVPPRRPVSPRAGRGRARHRRLQHAGHPARALRRRGPAARRRRHDRAHRAARRRHARRPSRWRHRCSRRGADPYRLAGYGALAGIVAFSAVIFSAPLGSPTLFRVGTLLIGFGGGLFARRHADRRHGARRQRQQRAGARRLGRGAGLGHRDRHRARRRHPRRRVQPRRKLTLLGPALTGRAVGYGVVYHLEILLLFATLVAIGPLVRPAREVRVQTSQAFGLAEFPG